MENFLKIYFNFFDVSKAQKSVFLSYIDLANAVSLSLAYELTNCHLA